MDILRGLRQVPDTLGATVVTIGVFDGVHRGHQLLISEAVVRARELGLPCVVMTFEPHPVAIFAPERAPKALIPFSERARLIEKLGVDHLVVIDFREELAGDSPEVYVRDVLAGDARRANGGGGENFTFGKDVAGDGRNHARAGQSVRHRGGHRRVA